MRIGDKVKLKDNYYFGKELEIYGGNEGKIVKIFNEDYFPILVEFPKGPERCQRDSLEVIESSSLWWKFKKWLTK